MATQTQFLNTVLDRLEKQISKTALLQEEIERQEKRTQIAEMVLNEREQDLEALRVELHRLRCVALEAEQKASHLSSELEDARLILEPLSLLDDLIQGLTYKDMAVNFVQKWGMQPADAYNGLAEVIYEKEAVSNGR